MPIKVDFNKEIHIFKDQFTSLLQLQQFVKASFKKLPQYFSFYYIDQDGDNICVSSDEDLQVLQESGKNQKMFIKEISQEAWILEQEEYQVIQVKKEEVQIPIQKIIEEVQVKAQDDTKVPLNNQEQDQFWVCPACTLFNKQYLFFCDVCGAMKPVEQFAKVEKKVEIVEKKVEIVEKKQDKVDEKKQVKAVEKKQDKLVEEKKELVVIENKIVDKKVEKQADKKKLTQKQKDQAHIKKLVQQEIDKSLQTIAEKVKAMLEQQQQPQVQNDYLSDLLNPKQEEKPKVVHAGYICDGCEGLIVGVRYECGICRNFDYCEKCESTIDHIHPFLKIKNPSQAVMIDFVSEKDLNQINKVNSEKSTSCTQQTQQVQTPQVENKQSTQTQQPQQIETIGKEKKENKKSKYPKEVKERAKQVKKILGGRARDYLDLCLVHTDINDAILSLLGGDQPKVVDPQVIKISDTVQGILGKTPEEYYEIVELLKDKPVEEIIEYILYQQEYEYKQK